MKTASVILIRNRRDLLEKFLPSIVQFSKIEGVSICVADNASTDNSISFIEENYPSIQLIKNKTNGGYAKGYNDALKHIDADVFALVNSDIEVTEGWLNPILSLFEKEPKTAIVQPKILDYKQQELFEYAGAGGGFID